MENETNLKKGTYVLPLFLSGAAVGAVIGVLFAPGSGKETRRKTMDWLKDKREKAKEYFQAKKGPVYEALAAGKKEYKEVSKKLAGV